MGLIGLGRMCVEMEMQEEECGAGEKQEEDGGRHDVCSVYKKRLLMFSLNM